MSLPLFFSPCSDVPWSHFNGTYELCFHFSKHRGLEGLDRGANGGWPYVADATVESSSTLLKAWLPETSMSYFGPIFYALLLFSFKRSIRWLGPKKEKAKWELSVMLRDAYHLLVI
jgi:hypothetical protein